MEIEKKIEELAEKIKYGSATIDIIISRGKVVKIIIKETQEVILFN